MKYLFFSNDGKLGDAIVHTIFVDGVLQNDKNAEIHCTVGGFNKFFWDFDNQIKKTWLLDKPSWIDVIQIGLKLRKIKFDYLVTWNNIKSEKIKLLFSIAKIKNKIVSLEYKNRHISNRDNYALKKIFQCDNKYQYSISSSLIIRIDIENYILLNLFAGDIDYSRTISKDNAIKIIEEILDIYKNNIKIVLNCHDNTELIAFEIKNLYLNNVIVKNCSKDIRQLISLVYYSNFVISTDSAVVHIACAFNKKLLSFYKKNNDEIKKWHPIGVIGLTYLSNYDNLNNDFPKFTIQNLMKVDNNMTYYSNDGFYLRDFIKEIN